MTVQTTTVQTTQQEHFQERLHELTKFEPMSSGHIIMCLIVDIFTATDTYKASEVYLAFNVLYIYLYNNGLFTHIVDNLGTVYIWNNGHDFLRVEGDYNEVKSFLYYSIHNNSEVIRIKANVKQTEKLEHKLQSELINKVIFDDVNYWPSTSPLYIPIPNSDGYKVRQVAPFDIINKNNKEIKAIGPCDGCNYWRYSLGESTFTGKPLMPYMSVIRAFAADLTDAYKLNIGKRTRNQYNKEISEGTLYVIDHIDNNPDNNEIINLRVITQQQNNSRRGKVKIVNNSN